MGPVHAAPHLRVPAPVCLLLTVAACLYALATCCACLKARPIAQPGRSIRVRNRCGLQRVEQQKNQEACQKCSPRETKGAVTQDRISLPRKSDHKQGLRRCTLTNCQQQLPCVPPGEAGQAAGTPACPILYQRPGSRAPGLPINQKLGSRPQGWASSASPRTTRRMRWLRSWASRRSQ